MLKSKEVLLVGAFLAGGLMMVGCAGPKQMSNTDVPTDSLSNDALSSKAGMKAEGSYSVKPKDCLWAIAGKSSVYGDAFEWPLLYKTNRDLIKNPDLIYPHQHLKFVRTVSAAMKKRAEKLASKTPQYKPGETQTVSYF